MALPEVGLQAVLANLSNFQKGAESIQKAYDQIGTKADAVGKATERMGLKFDEAAGRWRNASGQFASNAQLAAAGVENVKKKIDETSGRIDGIRGKVVNLGGDFINLGQSVLKFGAIAGGVALAGTVALTAGIVALGASALTEVAKFERMNLSIQNLVAREISGGKVIEQATQTRIQLTKKESEELEKLQKNIDNEINDRDVLSARIQEQKQRIIQLTAQYGEQGLVVIKERAELQGMELDLSDLSTEISDHQGRITELTGKHGQLISTLEKVRVGQVSMSEAMSKATPRAQELIKWIQLLAIQSPFTSEGIQNAFQTALAYGFTTEQAQRLTEAEVDFTAATGKSAQAADLIALALGQIQARGKLSAQELRQLSEQGIGTNRILEDMSFSLDDVTNGLVPVDTFIEAVIKDMEVFKGSAKDQATTFSGLVSSLQEIKSVALREFFTGTFEAIRPHLATFVDFLTQASLKTGDIKALGDTLGASVGSAMERIADVINIFKTRGLGGIFAEAGFTGFFKFRDAIKELFDLITSQLPSIDNFGATFDTLAKDVFPTLTSGIQFVIDHFEEFKGALLGIGAIIGGATFLAIVAGLLSLLTPINLIIAGVALLGAAWAGNWGGIQEKAAAAWAFIQPILMDLWQWLQTNIPIAIQFLSDAWNNVLFPALNAVWNFVSGTLFPMWLELQIWLADTISNAIQVLSDMWNNTLLPAITSVWDFIQTKIIPLWNSVLNLAGAIADKVGEALAGAWQNILLPALRRVWEFIDKNIMPIFRAIGDVIIEKLGPPMSNLSEKIMPALTKGFEAVGKAIKDVTSFFNDLANKVRNFKLPAVLTPGSPTPFELALIGISQAAQSAAGSMQDFSNALNGANFDKLLGIDRNLTDPLRIAGAAFDDLEKHLDKTIGKGKAGFALTNIKKAIKENISQILTSLDPTKTIDEIAAHAVPNWEKVGIKLQNVGDVFWKSFKENAQDAVATLQDMFIEAGRTAISIGQRLTGVIGGAVDLLNSRVERLQQIVAQGGGEFEGKVLSTVEAQNLLNQALQEQASIQDDILKTKEQEQKLNFLQQQLDLFDTIKEAGLDIGQILGGLHLGLDASIPDLIAATNKVIEAMINQVNADLGNISSVGAALGNALTGGITGSLGIASPSKVMQGLADNTMSSFMNRMLSWGPAIAGAAGSAIAGPTMVAAPALASVGAGSQTTINANFGGNSISSGMDEAQFDSMVLRSIQRLMR